MVAPIILYGSSVLRKYSAEITEEDNVIKISEMLSDTLKKAGGIGLAGPQINLLKRAFVIDTSPIVEDDITIEKLLDSLLPYSERIDTVHIVVGYKKDDIIKRLEGKYEKLKLNYIENEIYREGCLSFPGIYEDVSRPDKILVRYQDISFKTIEEELDGIKARIFQHEFDHLDGILFIDKINRLKRKLLKTRLNRIKRLALTIKNSPNYFNTSM